MPAPRYEMNLLSDRADDLAYIGEVIDFALSDEPLDTELFKKYEDDFSYLEIYAANRDNESFWRVWIECGLQVEGERLAISAMQCAWDRRQARVNWADKPTLDGAICPVMEFTYRLSEYADSLLSPETDHAMG